MARFDHAFTNNDRLYVSYFYYDTYTKANAGLPLFNGFNNWTNNHLVGNYTKIISPTVLNSLTYTLNRLAFVRAADPILPDQFPVLLLRLRRVSGISISVSTPSHRRRNTPTAPGWGRSPATLEPAATRTST